MPAGDNGGGQLNVLVFEVGMLIRDPISDTQKAVTLAIHPLLTVPSNIRYSDRSRSQVTKTDGASVKTTGGRAHQLVSLEGTFGVEERGIGPIIGTGDLRFKRFRREVVRLGEALFREDVDDALRALSSSPGLASALAVYDEETCEFYVNFYDFWHEERFEVHIPAFDFTKSAKRASATGTTFYTMQLREVGPIIGSGIGDELISALFQGLTVWTALNSTIESYTVDNIVAAQFAIPDIVISQLTSSVSAVTAQLDSATGIMSGQSFGGSRGDTTRFFGEVKDLIIAADDAIAALQGRATGQFDNESGQINWSGQTGEGDNTELSIQDEIATLLDVEDAALYQQNAGSLFGMGDDDYQTFISSSGSDSVTAPDLAGSITYAMTMLDTARSLEEKFGISWDEILKLNDLTPDEASVPGTELQIPQLRQRGTQRIDGLPVFGSHIGKAAWGVDLDMEMRGDVNGKPVLVSEEDALEQGAQILVEAFGHQMLAKVPYLPDSVRNEFLRLQLQTLFLSDKRFLSLDDVQFDSANNATLDIEVTLTAINGGTVRTGGNR